MLTAGPILSSRKFHLQKIIEKLFLLPEIPQIDRWLSLEFAKNKKFGSQDRKWYAEQIFLFVRYLYFILYYCEYQTRELKIFSCEIDSPKKLWDGIRQLSFEKIDSAIDFVEQFQNNHELLHDHAKSFSHSKNSQDIYPSEMKMQHRCSSLVYALRGVAPPWLKAAAAIHGTRSRLAASSFPMSIDEIFLNCSVPLWLKPNLINIFSELSELQYFLELQNTRPLLWIRLNHIDKRDEVLKDLSLNEFAIQTYENQKMLSLVGSKSVYQLESFKNGLFENSRLCKPRDR